MRTFDLGRSAAQAEILRIKGMVRRQVGRAVWGAIGAVFGIAVLAMLHVLAFILLAPPLGPVWAAVILLVFDGIVAGIGLMGALRDFPSRLETDARQVRDQALLEMRESLAIAALVGPVGRVAVRSAGRGVWGLLRRSRRR